MVGEGPLTIGVVEYSDPELLSTPSPRGPIWGWRWTRRGQGYYGAERGFRIKAEARAEKKRLKLAAQDAAAASLASPETTARTMTSAKGWASQVGVDPWPKGEAPKPTKSAGIAQPHQFKDTDYPRRYRSNGRLVVEYPSSFDDGTAASIKKIVDGVRGVGNVGKMTKETIDAAHTLLDAPPAPVRNDNRDSIRDDEPIAMAVSGFQEEEPDEELPPKAAIRTKPKKRMTEDKVKSLKDAYFAKGKRVTQCPTQVWY